LRWLNSICAGQARKYSRICRHKTMAKKSKRGTARAGFKSSRDVLIQCADLKKAAHFYETVLGLPVTLRTETMLGFETGAFCLYVEKRPPYGPVFDFHVPDLEAAKRKLVAEGCRVEDDDPSIPRCYVRDPFGLIFNLDESAA